MWSYNSETGTITMTKGDTPTLAFSCSIIDEAGGIHEYQSVEGDVFVFAVKKKERDAEPLFFREIDRNTMEVTLAEEDTKDLKKGSYIYEVSINNGNFHCTFIANKVLKLTTEIY